jgi:hypothetical protein
MRKQINVRLRAAMRDDPGIAAAIEHWCVSINLQNVPLDKRGRDGVVTEIVQFVKTAKWSDKPTWTFEQFEVALFPLLARYDAEYFIAPGLASLSVDEVGGTMDPYALYSLVARAVKQKSKPEKYSVSPLWLGVSTAALIPVLPEAFLDPRRVEEFDIHGTPFESIIVGSVMGARSYTKAEHEKR